jgi:hypothetical protein
VEFTLDDRDQQKLAEEIFEGIAEREWMATLLAAALLAYVECRVEEEGCGAQHAPATRTVSGGPDTPIAFPS